MQRGQSVVEFCLVAGVALMTVTMLLQLLYFLFIKQLVRHGSFLAARTALVNLPYASIEETKQRATDAALFPLQRFLGEHARRVSTLHLDIKKTELINRVTAHLQFHLSAPFAPTLQRAVSGEGPCLSPPASKGLLICEKSILSQVVKTK